MNGSIFQNFSNFCSKSGKNRAILAKNSADRYMNGSHFLENLVFVWVYFQILRRHVPTKPNLSTPPDFSTAEMCVICSNHLEVIHENSMLAKLASACAEGKMV